MFLKPLCSFLSFGARAALQACKFAYIVFAAQAFVLILRSMADYLVQTLQQST